jgi:phosphoglycerate kinase
MNCPIDPNTMEISGTKRIEEATTTINAIKDSKLVVASHQGRVGNKDYTGMEKHAKVLEKLLNRKIKYVQDIIGEAAQTEIKNLKDGDILLLDNWRSCTN